MSSGAKENPLDSYYPDKTMPDTNFGANTSEQYRYQYRYAALLAIEMYRDEIKCTDIMCEHHDDILIVFPNKKYQSVQVKTHLDNSIIIKLTDDEVINSFSNFVKLEKKFLGRFTKFTIISNCRFKDDDTQESIVTFLKEISDPGKAKVFTSEKGERIISDLCTEFSVSREFILGVLAKVVPVTAPDLKDIDDIIISRHLSKVSECERFSHMKLTKILRELVEEITDASSNEYDNAIEDFISFIEEGEVKLESEKLNARRITKDTVKSILKGYVSGTHLMHSKYGGFGKVTKKSIAIMKKKMHLGGIDKAEIDDMVTLVNNANGYIWEERIIHEDDPETLNAKLDHLIQVLITESVEAEVRAKVDSSLYGAKMLQLMEDDVKLLTLHNSPEMLGVPRLTLKGMIGMLTGDCKIKFSKVPKGGFK